jgi:hypothetical protein
MKKYLNKDSLNHLLKQAPNMNEIVNSMDTGNESDPSENTKNIPIEERIESVQRELQQISETEQLTPTQQILAKLRSNPFYLMTTTVKLMYTTIFPELMDSPKEEGFFTGVVSLFFRNYFKVLMILFFIFQIIYFYHYIKHRALKILLCSMSLLFLTLFIILIPNAKRMSVIILSILLFLVCGYIASRFSPKITKEEKDI